MYYYCVLFTKTKTNLKIMFKKIQGLLIPVAALLVGVMFADTIKPILAKIPFVGSFFVPSVNPTDDLA